MRQFEISYRQQVGGKVSVIVTSAADSNQAYEKFHAFAPTAWVFDIVEIVG
jgi:hypothetical protein